MKAWAWRILAVMAACAAAASAQAQGTTAMSRELQSAIRFYEIGEEMRAMDVFMEVLTKGDPTERAIANNYLGRISGRLIPQAPAPTQAQEPEPQKAAAAQEPRSQGSRSPSLETPAPEVMGDSKELIKKEFKTKLRWMQETSLNELQACQGVRIVRQENDDPLALGIPSSLLFSSGTSFKKEASKILDAITRLVFSLGRAQVVILPEGALVGDAKILDMRRSMGISSHLFQAGIAVPRVKVNLLTFQVETPKSLQDFKGIILNFVYNRPLGLSVESALTDRAGPPATLGVYPKAFRPDKDESVIIEFSISEPPAGLSSWKFQLLQPAGDGVEKPMLQELVSASPVFHQIYWNGRQNYFGPILPAGRYECVLSATDAKARTRTVHRWIELLSQNRPAAPTKAQPALTYKEIKPQAAKKRPAVKTKKVSSRKKITRKARPQAKTNQPEPGAKE